jgi:hypothetical protein
MSRSLFIYWKTGREQAAAAAAGMAAFQLGLRESHAGLAAKLYRRADETGESVTLMETYAQPGGLGAALQVEIIAAGSHACAGWCQGERHVEVFDEWEGGPRSAARL